MFPKVNILNYWKNSSLQIRLPYPHPEIELVVSGFRGAEQRLFFEGQDYRPEFLHWRERNHT